MGDHRVYRTHRYELGTQLLTIRTRVALTQSALAEQVGVHRRSIQNWETGVSSPQAETLQRLIAVFFRHGGFTIGNEREEAQALWDHAVQDRPLALPAFDPIWFDRLVALHVASPAASTHAIEREREIISNVAPPVAPLEIARAIIDWGEAIAVPMLYGREDELQTLQQWIVKDRCRVVALVGLGGIGKSSLAITIAQLVLTQFDVD